MFEENINDLPVFPVRLYVASVPADDSFFNIWYDRMPKARRDKADRIRTVPDRRRCITAYALFVRALMDLAAEFGLKQLQSLPDDPLLIVDGSGGKPYLADIPVCFNISHSNDRVAVALSCKEVGCDVECKSASAIKIAKRFFSKPEYEYLSSMEDEEERDRQFTKLWTLKESVVKCCGEGISHPFSDFSVTDKRGRRAGTVRLPGREDEFHLREYADENGYCYSVCSIYGETEDKIRRIEFGEE